MIEVCTEHEQRGELILRCGSGAFVGTKEEGASTPELYLKGCTGTRVLGAEHGGFGKPVRS